MTLPATATTPNLPTFPQIVQNRTGADTPPPPAPLANTSLPSLATPATAPPATSDPSPPRLLSTRQLNAIPLILAGLPDDQVARQIGVRRQAVCRWRNQHPRFIAELNRQRQLFHADTTDRYHRLLNQSMAHIERFHLLYGHSNFLREQVQLACTLLRSAAARHTLAPTTTPLVAPTNPADILALLLAQDIPPSPDDSPDDDENDDDPTPSPTPTT